MVNEADKDEVHKLLTQLPQARKSRFSLLFLKIAIGYAAVAVLTTTALLYSVFDLYMISSTARRIANNDLPVLTVLTRMRSSLLAQEGFAGKFAIFKDAAYIELFRQRRADVVADLELLERTKSVPETARLRALFLDYDAVSDRLFSGKSRDRKDLHASAVRLLTALDNLYIQRQGMLQTVLKRAHQQQKSTIGWVIAISSAGFVLACIIAPFIVLRLTRALGKLQKETHRLASGDFNYRPQVPAVAEISELAEDFNEMAARITEMEQKNLDALPHTRLPGNQAIERVLNERLKSGAPFSFCHIQLDSFQQFLAGYGYARAGELLHETGVVVYSAVSGLGTEGDFAGHAGGDNFVMIVSPDKVAAVCDAVVQGVDGHLKARLIADEPTGTTDPWPAVSIAVVECSNGAYRSAVEVARAVMNEKSLLRRDRTAPGNGAA